MLDIVDRSAERIRVSETGPVLRVKESPALEAYIESRKNAAGPIGLLLRAAGHPLPAPDIPLEAEIAAIEAEQPDRRWLAEMAKLLRSAGTMPTGAAADAIARVVTGEAGRRPGSYPLFGSLCFVSHSGGPAARQALSHHLARAAAAGGAIGASIRDARPANNDPRLAGALLKSAFHAGWEGAPLATALRVAEVHASKAIAASIGEQLIERLPPGDDRRVVALRYIERVSGRPSAMALALELTQRERCPWAAQYAAEVALEGGNVGLVQRLLSFVDRDSEAGRRVTRAVELRIALRLGTDRLRFAPPSARKDAARALTGLIADAPAMLPIEQWWSSAEVLIDHMVEVADLEAFDRLVEIGIVGADTARPVAIHLLGGARGGAVGDVRPADETIVERLLARARSHRRLGRPEAALMLFRLAALIGELREVERLELAYLALMLGRFGEALATAAPLSRIYAAEIGAMPWPSDRIGVPWPYAPMPVAADLEAALPAGATWPRISVVVPSFNQVKYVRECLQSLVLQNYPNLEIIVFDAVSTDGTIAILEEFRGRVASLIIEKDNGQSDAINKGLTRATGDLLHWLNTDDLLAPGACHSVALAYLDSKADIIAGACIEFSDRQMRLLNLASADAEDFRVEELCKQFDRWLQGNFFYQPEVFFSRRIWELTGGQLDPTHHLAMDFDLWLRSASAGARYQRIHWPVAFFRKHAEQKTSQLEDTIDEQAEIIARAVPQVPSAERNAEIDRRLAVARAAGGGRKIAVVTKRYDKIFSDAVEADLTDDLADLGTVTLFKDARGFDPAAFDAIIHLTHAQMDYADIVAYRSGGFAGAVAAWFWDNHHNYFDNRRTAEATDVIVPGHAFCATYLANPKARLVPPVPLCVTQWGRNEARDYFARFGHGPRSDQISGGFVDYSMSSKRSRLVVELLDARASDALLLLKETDLSPYFGMSRADRFENWCAYKTSLCLPLRRDLSQRFFDGWLTGQVVVVPDEITDLVKTVPAEIRARHMVTFDKWTPAAVMAAQAKAIALFDAGGAAGVVERHQLALSQHMFADRIRTILERW